MILCSSFLVGHSSTTYHSLGLPFQLLPQAEPFQPVSLWGQLVGTKGSAPQLSPLVSNLCPNFQ